MPQFRCDDVADALLAIIHIEQPNAVLAAALAHRLDERRASRIGGLVAPGLGGDGVILHGESQIGAAHRAPLLFKLRKGVMRMQFVQNVAIDVEQIAAVGALSDAMRIPDFVEQCARHCVATRMFLPAEGAKARPDVVFTAILGVGLGQSKLRTRAVARRQMHSKERTTRKSEQQSKH